MSVANHVPAVSAAVHADQPDQVRPEQFEQGFFYLPREPLGKPAPIFCQYNLYPALLLS